MFHSLYHNNLIIFMGGCVCTQFMQTVTMTKCKSHQFFAVLYLYDVQQCRRNIEQTFVVLNNLP